MVNRRLRGEDTGARRALPGRPPAARIERIFATKAALTARSRRAADFQEVVLVQTIHGLLRSGRQFLPWGLRDRCYLGRSSPAGRVRGTLAKPEKSGIWRGQSMSGTLTFIF